jgi:hypothetical protein
MTATTEASVLREAEQNCIIMRILISLHQLFKDFENHGDRLKRQF